MYGYNPLLYSFRGPKLISYSIIYLLSQPYVIHVSVIILPLCKLVEFEQFEFESSHMTETLQEVFNKSMKGRAHLWGFKTQSLTWRYLYT